MCTCPAEDVVKGTCGAVLDADLCSTTTIKRPVVWRGAQDLGTLCMPPNCWVDGVPDDQYTDPVSCTQQPFSEWVVSSGTKDISGTPSDPDQKIGGLTKTQWIYVGVAAGVIILVIVLAAALTPKSKTGASSAPPPGVNAMYPAAPVMAPPASVATTLRP